MPVNSCPLNALQRLPAPHRLPSGFPGVAPGASLNLSSSPPWQPSLGHPLPSAQVQTSLGALPSSVISVPKLSRTPSYFFSFLPSFPVIFSWSHGGQIWATTPKSYSIYLVFECSRASSPHEAASLPLSPHITAATGSFLTSPCLL